MKVRSALSATEVVELHAEIDRKLSGMGVETQPAVAGKILSLVSDPQSGMRQYADVVKHDAALTGRLLRLANSAYFAQVKPVTTLERACVLMGLERLKAVSLGFYLSRAAASDPNQVLSRRVWGESVLRACLASELARLLMPSHVAEAFTIGLMLDAGLPLAHRLMGKPLERIVESGEPPAQQFTVEFEGLPFTHVDVVAVLMRRWSLPELLSRPIEWHHTPPGDAERREPVHVLHRVAYTAGSVLLTRTPVPRVGRMIEGVAGGTLKLPPDAVASAVRKATEEYAAVRVVFRDVADRVDDLASMAERVHAQLVSVMDESMIAGMRDDAGGGPARFTVAGHCIEIETERDGRAVAYLRDERGERLISHTFERGRLEAMTLLDALGIEPPPPGETQELERHLRSLAA